MNIKIQKQNILLAFVLLTTVASFSGMLLWQNFKLEQLNRKIVAQAWEIRSLTREQLDIAHTLGKETIDFSEAREYAIERPHVPIDRSYIDGEWNLIITDVLGGFDKDLGLTEKIVDPNLSVERSLEKNEYLRREGGLGPVYYYLETSSGKRIDSKEELLDLINGIDSEAEAASFVYMQISDLLVENNTLVGHTLTHNGNYYVQVVHQNTFGCGLHEPLKAIYIVTKKGDIYLDVTEKGTPITDEMIVLCID